MDDYLKLKKKPLNAKGIPKKEYLKGEREELDHTTNHRIAKQIALDHLHEQDNYYTDMEKEAFDRGFIKAALAVGMNPLEAANVLNNQKKQPKFLPGVIVPKVKPPDRITQYLTKGMPTTNIKQLKDKLQQMYGVTPV